jgi:NAD(P)-dependent dehydrogenase (short-subunit alcohol dehydrogenase family)
MVRNGKGVIMKNKNILITGGTSGMGKATALRLAKLGTRLLLVGHNQAKGDAALADIIATSGNERVTYARADLSVLTEMRRLAEFTRGHFKRLDALVHAAGGVFPSKRILTEDGVEFSFALQFLARFVLTGELYEPLLVAADPKVVSLAGGGTVSGQLDFDNLNGETDYRWYRAIAKDAQANDLLTLEQIDQYPGITFYNYGPGFVLTNTVMRNAAARIFFKTLARPLTRSPESAADDIVMLLAGDYPSGLYDKRLQRNDPPIWADATARKRLWDYGTQLAIRTMQEPPEPVSAET